MDPIALLQDRIEAFETSKISREAFERWFVDFWCNTESSASQKVAAAFRKVEGILAESSHAQWGLAELREELANAVCPPRLR